MDAPRARFRLSVHSEIRDSVELIPEVDARRPDRCQIPEAGTRGVYQRSRDVERLVGDVAEIEERDASELAEQRLADFRRPLHHRQTADRQTETTQRADLEPSPTADARCAAEEIALEERDAGAAAKCVDGAEMDAVRPHERSGHACVVASLAADFPVVVGPPQPLACLLEVRRQHVSPVGVEDVVRRIAIDVEGDRPGRAAGSACSRIETQSYQIVSNREVLQALVADGAALKLVDQGNGPVALRIRLMTQRGAPAK